MGVEGWRLRVEGLDKQTADEAIEGEDGEGSHGEEHEDGDGFGEDLHGLFFGVLGLAEGENRE
jgi:hypothetical protein